MASLREFLTSMSSDWRQNAAAACLFGVLAFHSGTSGVSAQDFATEVRPFLEAHCLDCHSTRAKKSGLDLERFETADHVREDVEPWESTLGMLEREEMPPRDEPRPAEADRLRVIDWIRNLLEDEAQRRAGDPGPPKVRRLNNAEYRYTIRDLTGVDLRPGRHFPADGAAGEGFLNATDALTISPDQLTKYLDAARGIAAHVVLLPGGFRFSESKFQEDWVNEIRAEISKLHGRYANDTGGIPLESYLRATLDDRDAIRSGDLSFARIGERDGLSPGYLQKLWNLFAHEKASILLEEVQARWREGTPEKVGEIIEQIALKQDLLWHKQAPLGEHALDDRFVPAKITLAKSHDYRLDISSEGTKDEVFYIVPQVILGSADSTRILLENPRVQIGEEEPVSLREVLLDAARVEKDAQEKAPPPTEGVTRLNASGFVNETIASLGGTDILEVRLPRTQIPKRVFITEARLADGSSPDAVVRLYVQRASTLARLDRGIAWQYAEPSPDRRILVTSDDEAARKRFQESADEFRALFPPRICYPGLIVVDATVTLERFHRGDSSLSRLFLDEQEGQRLDLLWDELHFVSSDALQVWNSLDTLLQGEMKPHEGLKSEVERRGKAAQEKLLAAEPSHLESLLELSARAYRRPLSESERRSLLDHYQTLREKELTHDEAFRAVLARVFVSPNFLYRIESQGPGKEPGPVNDWELATRLSYFIWASQPDEELRELAAAGRLSDPVVLAAQTRRMLGDPRVRALAIEFATQWLEIRAFDGFQGKNLELFPDFDAGLRAAMYEESIRFFQDIFEADRRIDSLIVADHTFLNETLARHYGIAGVEGVDFRRVAGVSKSGRGGILGLASVLSKHSGASRTSPVLRGNWVAEFLLGDRLPRPPDGVPELPDGESVEGLSVRELVEKHAEVEECAVCHKRIDPLGFALEEFDTIGRRREKDLGGRPVDARARLSDGVEFEGIHGLRQYLLTQRKSDLVRQFCRKLLGYALGRRVLLSDRQLVNRMVSELHKNDGRVSAAILAVVESKQFKFIRGSDATKRSRF